MTREEFRAWKEFLSPVPDKPHEPSKWLRENAKVDENGNLRVDLKGYKYSDTDDVAERAPNVPDA